jgi:hypothetical protein
MASRELSGLFYRVRQHEVDRDVGVAEAENASVHERWAHTRFAVIGQLLAAPPEKGALRGELKALAARTWRHPVTGEPAGESARGSFSTLYGRGACWREHALLLFGFSGGAVA